jgi:hypothetical protein
MNDETSKFVDTMIGLETQIKSAIRNNISASINDSELYYYTYHLVIGYYEKLEIINDKILSEYSIKSLNNFISSHSSIDDNDLIESKRAERIKEYEILWNQIHYDDDRDKSTKMAMYFGFVGEYIFRNKSLMMPLTALHPKLLSLLSRGVDSYLSATSMAVKKTKGSLSEKIKSFFSVIT